LDWLAPLQLDWFWESTATALVINGNKLLTALFINERMTGDSLGYTIKEQWFRQA